MSWIYLDDGFAEHPKVLAITDAALRLEIAGLCYANRYLTNGNIPAEWVDRRTRSAGQLVTAGLWVPSPNGVGWQIHDYLDWQKSAEQVRKEREKAAERQRRSRGGKQP